MKTSPFIIGACAYLFGSTLSAIAEDYITQTDLTPVADGEIAQNAKIDIEGPDGIGSIDGSTPAAFPIGPYGSRFDLYTTIETSSGRRVYHLGSSVVGPYPTASISMTSNDPYIETRTRADQRFGASVTVSNISADPEAPLSMKQVYVEHLIDEYPVGSYTFSTTNPADWRLAKQNSSGEDAGVFIVKDGTLTITIPDPDDGLGTALTSLDSPNNENGESTEYYQCGEEKVVVYARPSSTSDWVTIAEKKIRVFPLPSAQIIASHDNFATTFELNSNTEYTSVPSIYAVCNELYPTSVTTIRLYKGTLDNLGDLVVSDLELVDGSEPASFNTIQPQDGVLMLNNTEPEIVALEDGYYTVELVTVTPFNNGAVERIAWAEFQLKKSLRINANLSSQK
ncbi:hypothetical protein [Rubritalea tangerina]|uniref:Uncharacterized protein n=1 Tax=Rubritalea tangerina TaxID=430798 RepID=A0ABW4ZEJ8_9BACT